MSDESNKWDSQWSALLTHCHGMNVEASPVFKSSLLDALKAQTARNLDAQTAKDDADSDNWNKLLNSAYTPCHPDENFKYSLMTQLKSRQQTIAQDKTQGEPAPTREDTAIRTLLTHSYEPIAPRREFETRLLDNLKERQRRTTTTRLRFRRRALFMSAASSIAAAAMVMLVVWVMPANGTVSAPSSPKGNLRLIVPDAPLVASASETTSEPQQINVSSDTALAEVAVVPAAYEVPSSFSNYRIADAFSGPALPKQAYPLQNMEMDSGEGWVALTANAAIALVPGLRFRSSGGMGHLEFPDGSMLSLSPETRLDATSEGLSVAEGLLLVTVPDYSSDRFRLHFPERDIAVEPGTDLAVLVEPQSDYAAGGAPAPMVMVVDRQDSTGGLALARGKNGVGPLLAKQIYRLDHYVTPDLPSRTLCDTECQDLEKFYKAETLFFSTPPASLVGGFGGAHDRDGGYTTTVLKPAGFTKEGDRWVAESYKGEATVKLKYLSDAYFGFANERRDLARALSLGGELIIDGGDGSFYEIHK